MAGYRVELTELCQIQITKIRNYIENDLSNISASKRFIESLKRLVSSLKEYPYRFVSRPYSLRYGEFEMRQVCFVMNYTAYYVIDEKNKTVIIAEIRYSKQDTTDI